MNPNIRMIQIVADELEKLKEQFVFVGDSVVSLYLTDPAMEKVRATDDVDCVTEVAMRADYYKIEEKLRDPGFYNVPGKVICRWSIRGGKVDIMPSQKGFFGFANRNSTECAKRLK
jgi:hypothetical protein